MTFRRWTVAALMTLLAPAGMGAGVESREATRLVQRATDPVTGAEVRVFKGPGRELRLEVEKDRLLVRKRVGGSTVDVTVVNRGEVVGIALEPGAVTFSGSRGQVRVTREDPSRLEATRATLAESEALHAARALLGRIRVREDSPLRQALLSTRALIEGVAGKRDASRELAAWHRALGEGRVRRVNVQNGPDDCWNEYAKEAIQAYKEYEQCMADEQWWDVIGMTGCALVYDVRALGAFTWYLTCVGAMRNLL
jgi:hypothetical protein